MKVGPSMSLLLAVTLTLLLQLPSLLQGFTIGPSQRAPSTRLNSNFQDLAKSITGSFNSLPKTASKLTPSNIKPALEDIREAMVKADVNLQVVDSLLSGVSKKCVGQEIVGEVTGSQYFVKIMYDELTTMMGGTKDDTENTASPAQRISYKKDGVTTLVMAGLQGAGKTTFCAKLAKYLTVNEVDYDAVEAMEEEERKSTLSTRLPKSQRKVLIAACDVYRPAAREQLVLMANKAGVQVYEEADAEKGDAVKIASAAAEFAEKNGYDTLIVDTAGRQVVDENLMKELRDINKALSPDEILLVVDSMTGQAAASVTAAFDAAVGITGAILTKTDGDSRGGAAVSINGVSGRPIKFMGTGEKVDDITPFFPKRMASRILGMGDIVSLVEKASAEVSDAEAEAMAKKMEEGSFDFDDFLSQSKMVSKMGSFAGVAKMIPGMGGQIDDKMLRKAEVRLKKSEAMINSMTKKEKSKPELLLTDKTARSRLDRIAKGSGNEYMDAVNFMSEFQKMKTMMSRMQKQMGGEGTMEAMGTGDTEAMAGAVGNRSMRRAAKKNKKSGRGGGGGFG
ncbi:hypothetical protein TrVE_jg8479 [Triparma verrucosa]|uniref:signal-recognition-particle GTPase n=1 Tax=Triparma verrucosa TaxID=1606542 RepID=A0A9W7BSW7_9STRA|nr:hypothetical protein TrVE_jg8479 [Triparma verrucosa]